MKSRVPPFSDTPTALSIHQYILLSDSPTMITPPATALWLLVALIPVIAAQTEANCTIPQYNWMFNSDGLSPCHVADQLAQPCTSQIFKLPPLLAGQAYLVPSIDKNNTCICNSVFYSLLSACSACQNGTWLSWALFTTNCTAPSLTVYPDPVPPTVKVPHWAYLNVNDAGSFNVIVAENAGGPESTSPASATSTSSTPTSTSSSTSSPQSSSSVGPIAGGVIGGVLGVALIACVAIFFYRRGRHRSDHSNGLMSGPDIMCPSPPTAWNGSPPVPALLSQKLYDPQDPSTFPPDMYTNVPQSLTGTTYTTSRQEGHRPTPSATYYAGVPEV